MSRGKRLSNIANGLCGWFVSRNNTLDGYWSIGKLRSLADEHGQTTVLLDVLTSSTQPTSSDMVPLSVRSCRHLAKLAERSGVPFEDIAVARIAVDFAPPAWSRTSYDKQQWGDQFTVTVIIGADGRATGIERHAGYCRSHDPTREGQSIRPAGS